MNTLVYVGGEIKGYELNIGEKLTFIKQREFNEMGITVKLNVLWSEKEQQVVYVTANELTECFRLVA